MNEYIISDTHFNHRNIIKYCERPFHSENEMNEILIKNWNEIVKEDDIVYHLGDFMKVFRNPDLPYSQCALEQTRAIVQRLNGKIIYLEGNHRCINRKQYKEAGFYEFHDKPIYKDNYVFTHRPMDKAPKGLINVHGHVHNTLFTKLKDFRHINVSVEVIGYKPIPISDLMNYTYDKVPYLKENDGEVF